MSITILGLGGLPTTSQRGGGWIPVFILQYSFLELNGGLQVALVVAFFLLPRARVTFCKGVAAVAGPLDPLGPSLGT